MIRDYDAVRGSEGPAAPGIETNTRFLQMFEPLRRWFELIFVLYLFERWRTKEPHALIGSRRRGEADYTDDRH